jgi:prepilin-type N-terminal cleavage/methylation domain-containing protein
VPGKIRKLLHNQKGFTLVELMTVLIILGIILAIGIPKYAKIQAQAEWDADKAMIESFAKAAEMYVIKNDIDLSATTVTLGTLIAGDVIDGNKKLNRVNGSKISKTANVSYKNTSTSISDYSSEAFEFDLIGNVTNLEDVEDNVGLIVKLIGKSPYDT